MKYQFKNHKEAILQDGYDKIIIQNGQAEVTTDEQKKIAISNGGQPVKKAVKKAGK